MATVLMAPVLSSLSTKRGSKEFRSVLMAPVLNSLSTKRGSREFRSYITIGQVSCNESNEDRENNGGLYRVQVERNVPQKCLAELGISRWKTGKCKLPWDWQACRPIGLHRGRGGESGV